MVGADETKLKATIAYLVERTRPGKLKLFKLLYLADFAAYWEFGRAITGETYEHWEHGPVPKWLWSNFDTVIAECANIEEVSWPGVPLAEQRMTPKGTPDWSALSADEVRILDAVVGKFGHMTGRQLRTFTHESIPYKATSLGEDIPYYLAPYREKPFSEGPTREERERVRGDDTVRKAVDALLQR